MAQYQQHSFGQQGAGTLIPTTTGVEESASGGDLREQEYPEEESYELRLVDGDVIAVPYNSKIARKNGKDKKNLSLPMRFKRLLKNSRGKNKKVVDTVKMADNPGVPETKHGSVVEKGQEEHLSHHTKENHEAKTAPIAGIIRSVVLIGLWDPEKKLIHRAGSGFIADTECGLIVTAGHVLFDMESRCCYKSSRSMGMQNARVAIGVLRDTDSKTAVWRYFGEIIVDDIQNNIDACVVRITSKLERDIDEEFPDSENPEITLDSSSKIKDESLIKLEIEPNFQLCDTVWLIGFSQGEVFSDPDAPHRQVLRSPDIRKGYICRFLQYVTSRKPQEKIVLEQCPTREGQSGGPVVNDAGVVLGILSYAAPAPDTQRCYLVTAGNVASLVKKAREMCPQPTGTKATAPIGVYWTTVLVFLWWVLSGSTNLHPFPLCSSSLHPYTV